MEDKKIIDLFFERSESAIEELNLRYGKLCHQVAGNILDNVQDAEECVNDAYLGVWNTIPPERPESLVSYMCRIVRNISLKRYHYNTASKRDSKYDVALSELEDCLSSEKAIDEEFEESELTRAINKYLSSLKKTDQVIFMRRYYFSDSYEEIATRTGISEKNVSVRLVRLRNKLREHLKKEGYIGG